MFCDSRSDIWANNTSKSGKRIRYAKYDATIRSSNVIYIH